MRRIRTKPRSWRALLVGCGVLLGSTLGAHGAAADGGAARVEAREHFKRGVALAKQRAYAEALSEFQRAYAAVPHFSVLYNVGQAQIALGQSAEAVATLQRYLDEGGADIDAQRRAEVEQVLAREREKTPPLVAPPVVVPPPPAATSPASPPVVEPSPPASSAAVPPVDVKDVAIPPASRAETPAATPQPKGRLARARRVRTPKASAATQRTFAYVMGAAGLALSGSAVAHYLWNRGRYHDWQAQYASYYRDPTEPNRRAANALSDSIDRASAVTVVLAVGAGVALGTSGVLWVTSSPPSSDQHAHGLDPFLNLQGTF